MVDNNMTVQGFPQGFPSTASAPQGNPLAKHLRQPKIYIKLPSGGKYWPKGALEPTDTGEYPVYAMTARDEITFKTPDALLNGQSTVDVIQSCMPNIKDAWQTPSIDLDTILVAIRIASFGETIDMTTKVPNTNLVKDFTFNLQNLYDKFINVEFEDTFNIPGFLIQIKPVSYKTATQQSLKAFEEQRIFALVGDADMQESEKLQKFQTSFKKLTDINVNIMIESVTAIQPDGEDTAVVNPVHLKEFLENCDASVFNGIRDHIEKQKAKFTQAPVEVESTEEEREAGAPEKYTVPVTFDQSNFFGSGS